MLTRRRENFLWSTVLICLLSSGVCWAEELLEPGLVAEFFDLNETVTDFPVLSTSAVPVFKRVDPVIDFEPSKDAFAGTDLRERFFVRWKGKIRIPSKDAYTFFLNSDDGSRLLIDNSVVIDNGGVHGWQEKSGTTELASGLHDIEIDLFQNEGFSGCLFSWETASRSKKVVPANVLFHSKTTALRTETSFWYVSPEKLNRYTPRLWQTDQGLPHNWVQSILQTRDGYIWVGTPQGLARFDGVQFKVFTPQNTPGLKGKIIRSLCQTHDGTLWIGTEDGGLNAMRNGEFHPEPLTQSDNIKVLFESHDGALWIGTGSGLGRLQNGKLRWFTKSDGLAGNTLVAICEDRENNLWFGTSAGLTRYREKFEETYNQQNGLWANSVRSLFCDSQNRLWIGLSGAGLMRLENGKFTGFAPQEGLPDGFVSAIFEDSRGELWVGTMGGLCRRVGEKFAIEPNLDGMSYEAVFTLMESREAGLWLGTKDGLTQLHFKPFRAYTKQQGLSHNNIMSVLESGDGTLWMGTWGAGLSGLKNGAAVRHNSDSDSLYNLILSLRETRDGSLWLGADYDGGLFRFKDGTFTRYSTNNGIKDQAIRVVFEDSRTNLWLGTSGGLYLKQGEQFHRFLTGETVRAITEDQTGGLWVGTHNGLWHGNGEPFQRITALTTKVLSIFADREQALWVGTDGDGLKKVSKQGNGADFDVTSYVTQQAGSDTVFEILDDDGGNLWMSSFSGIFRVKKKALTAANGSPHQTFSCTAFGKADGLLSVQCSSVGKPGAWKSKDGRLWFPTTQGVVVVDPKSIRDEESAPTVVVEELVAEGLRANARSDVTLPAGRNEFEIHYTALSFAAPEKNRFRYKLEGIDADWMDAVTRRVAYYNNIKPGDYVFRVQGCNNEGIWNETGASLRLTLLPHFWQTKCFAALAGLVIVGCVGGIARYAAERKLRRNLEKLEQEHAIERERTRIAQDMHDDLGARLTEILLLSDRVQKSRAREESIEAGASISKVTRDVASGINAIVWAVNPKNDSLEKMISYISNYAVKFLGQSSIECELELPDDIPALPVSSDVRHNVFLVCKEALNNVVKHSGASEVRLTFKVLQCGFLHVIIADNGNGFLTADQPAFRNGLQNMEKRMAAMNGKFQIESSPGKGTRIELELLLKANG